MTLVLDGLLIVIALVARAFFAGSETAITAADGLQIEHLVRHGDHTAALVERLQADRQTTISALLVGTNLTGVLATVLANGMAYSTRPFGDASLAVSTVLMILITIVFTEIVPKSYAANRPLQVAMMVARPVSVSRRILGPIGRVFALLPRLFVRGRDSTADPQMTEDSLRTMIAIGEEEGAVAEDEREMIFGLLDASDTSAWQIMTPRVEMVYVAIDDPIDEILDRIEREGFSRIPVYEGNVDNIIGVLHGKDLLPYCLTGEVPDLRRMLRPVIYVPEAKRAAQLLEEMRRARIHLAVVLDEYGGTAGIVTIEDMLEEIFGEIHDEYDFGEEDPFIERGSGSTSIDAGTSIEEVNEELGLALPDDEADTIGGLVYSVLGRVPQRGERVTQADQGVTLTAERVLGRRVVRVRLDVAHAATLAPVRQD